MKTISKVAYIVWLPLAILHNTCLDFKDNLPTGNADNDKKLLDGVRIVRNTI